MAQIFKALFTVPGLVAVMFLIAAVSPSLATWLLTNVLSVLGPLLQPLLVFGIVAYGIRLILRKPKK